ncbi:adenylate/guanylate cyclase domain-containing protein [Kiloniella sp.]|uniref:adenylate/guanylate cyclase domain-containing protein n=1 Tax=Kiloniella sp. TaxID=1938587 RepID=UPI003B02127B
MILNTENNFSSLDQAKMLVHETEGWRLAPVIDWMFSPEAKTLEPDKLIQGCIDKFMEVGAPINRLRYSVWSIHPQLALYYLIWTKKSGKVETIEIPHGVRETSAFIGSPAEAITTTRKPHRYRLEDLDLEKEHPIFKELYEQGVTDYLGIPLLSASGEVHVMFISTDKRPGFSDQDITKLIRFSDFLQPKMEVLSMHRLSVELLNTYLGKRTSHQVLGGQIKRGDGELIEAALWYCDLRDFTPLSETLSTDELLDTLNTYFELVFDAVDAYGGEVLSFIGDAMLAVFPKETAGTIANACNAALNAAEEAFASLAVFNQQRLEEGKPEIKFGVGLHEGTVIYGNVGAPSRLDFTVMGPAVNRTARLESLTKTTGSPLLMSKDFVGLVDRETMSRGFHTMKGIEEPQEVFTLLSCENC